MAAAPLRYQPSFETPEPDEAETQRELVETLEGIIRTVYQDSGHALRSVHAKSHGLLQGELRVLGGLPEELAQGLFRHAATYPVVLRISTNPGDILDDSIGLPRGLAMKVLGVEGERVPGDTGGTVQDFVMVNGPVFAVPNARKFLGTLKLLAKTTDSPQVLKKAVATALRGAETVLEAVGGESATLKTLGGHPRTHPLGETFYTQVPILYGPSMAKLSLAPVSPSLKALKDQAVKTGGHPDALREAINAYFAEQGGEWELRAQLCTNLETMPIEDASVLWPEEESPYRAVATLSVPRQTGWSEARAELVDERLSFSPWHALAEHRPLGSVMRARRPAYEASAALRTRLNGCPLHAPTADETLPA